MEKQIKVDTIGRIVYFSLVNLLVKREDLAALCAEYEVPYNGSRRIAVSDAFRSATSSVSERVILERDGEKRYGHIFFRENRRTKRGVSKELILEIKGSDSNCYLKLAKLSLDVKEQTINVDELVGEAPVDAGRYCRMAQERFERFKQCAGRRKIETVCTNYLFENRATKLGVNAHIYFLPHTTENKAKPFVRFVRALGEHNEYGTPLAVNSFPLLREAEQCNQMAEEFYASLQKEIEEYRERADYLLSTDSPSPSVMERWVHKIRELELKRMDYERVLGRSLSQADCEFEELENLSRKLGKRADMIRVKREV